MALLKKILRNTPQEIIVMWTGSGADTLTLASITSTGQTVTGTANAVISAASSSNTGLTTITRNSEVTLNMIGNYDFKSEGLINSVLNQNSTHDVVVNLAAVGTLILKLRKTIGYSDVAF